MFLWGFPISAFVATLIYWPVVQREGLAFPVLVLSVPFLFAIVVIRTTTVTLRLWSWQMPMIQLAFLWSTYSALGILILGDTIAAPLSLLAVTKSTVFCALLGGGIGTLVDIVGIDQGLLTLHYCSRHQGTVETVLSYSFTFFGIFSAIFGVLAMVGHFILVELGATRWLPALIICASALLSLPFLVHFLLPGKQRVLGRERAFADSAASVPLTREAQSRP